jgi:hypothetical protein
MVERWLSVLERDEEGVNMEDDGNAEAYRFI